MASAAEKRRVAADDAHFRDVLARLPAHMVVPEDAEADHASKYYKNAKGAAPEAARKEKSRAKKAEAKAAKVSKRAAAGDDDDGLAADGLDEDAATPGLAASSEPLDEVRARLRERLEGLKGGRGGEAKPTKKRTKREAAVASGEDQRRAAHDAKRRKTRDAAKAAKKKAPAPAPAAAGAPPAPRPAPPTARVGGLRRGEADAPAPRKVGAPGSKARRLKALAAGADREAREIASLEASGDAAGAAGRKWAEALRVASGDRPAVDPAKIKKALKAREKKKDKSARDWKKRGRAQARHFAAKTVPSGRRAPKDES